MKNGLFYVKNCHLVAKITCFFALFILKYKKVLNFKQKSSIITYNALFQKPNGGAYA